MKYAIIKNVPLAVLLRNAGSSKIEWAKYGVDLARFSEKYADGGTAEGDHVAVLPIKDEDAFNSQLPRLQKIIEDNKYQNDSISLVNEAGAKVFKDAIKDKKAADKAGSSI